MAEKYSGLKFEVELENGKRELEKARKLIKWCKAFYKMGIASPQGNVAGNISVRTKLGFLITPSGNDFAKITVQELVEVIGVNEETRIVKAIGRINPSSEAFLHAGIYNKRKDVNAILHGHNSIVTEHARGLGIPETEKEEPYGTIELKNAVLKILNDYNLLQMKNHGFIALGTSLREAGKRAQELCKKASEKFG